ncbi:MAG: site-specific integrase [Candidatus Acididesulfobacter guangdongensis]|uniref:Site-specific integrase n=1 Tax=Acididesulfobacter guangdongensis TaxID=2597225 RepID=A0A519BHC2_ACIG2|nr:MAG: site-specific integrase [Candidatus Acididesulfobacter guangdongensis]
MGLFKRKNSPYYFMKFQLNGQRIYESTKTKNKKFAEEIFLNRRNEIINGVMPIREKEIERSYTFDDLSGKYIEWMSGRQKGAKVKGYIIGILVKRIGKLKLNQISINDMEQLQSDYLKNDYKISYINKILTVFKAMYNKALDWEMITEEDLKRVRKAKQLKGENKRLRYLSDEEAERLIDSCDNYLKPIVITALNTGMRKSEILQLTWDRVDLKNRIILLDITKNGERREIPINNTLFKTLIDIVRRIDVPYVFFNQKTLKPYDNHKRSFATALRKSRIIDFHFHDLRHTFASQLVMKGIDLTTVKELLGHKDIKMTLRYSHLSQAHIKKAVEILDDRCKIVAVDYKEEIEKL